MRVLNVACCDDRCCTVPVTAALLVAVICLAGCAGDATQRSAASQPATEAQLDAIRGELLARAAHDQEVRTADFGSMTNEERSEAFARFTQVDHENTARMKEIVATYGWPTISMVGGEASDAAFLLVQHADDDPEFQIQCLPLLEEGAQRGEVGKPALALLTDRVRVKQRRPQMYGTQYYMKEHPNGGGMADADGNLMYLLPIVEEIEQLDERRAAMELKPWREYEQDMAQSQNREPSERPRAWNGNLPVDTQRDDDGTD